jgi:hypothetical protein
MLIIRRLNCIDAASGIVTLKISEWPKITLHMLSGMGVHAHATQHMQGSFEIYY